MSKPSWCAKCGGSLAKSLEIPSRYSNTAVRLLSTNEPPQPFEKILIRKDLQRGCDMLARVNEEIAVLQATLSELQTTKEFVERFIDDHKIVLSPLRCIRLPPEILTEIFRCVAPVVDTDVKRGIWPLGRVCSYWRTILLSSPSLWSTARISTTQASVTEAILSRSGNALLDLELFIHHPVASASGMIDMFLAESQRWYKAELHVSPFNIPQLSALKGRIPRLYELTYHGQQFPEWVAAAPSLQHLYYISVENLPLSLAALHAPWSQLCRCILQSLNLEQEIELLRLCPNLEEYRLLDNAFDTVNESYSPSQQILISQQILMPKLHTLQYSFSSAYTILNRLVLPSLTCITLYGDDHDAYNGNAAMLVFANLVTRSSGPFPRLNFSFISWMSTLPFQFISQPLLHSLTILQLSCSLTMLLSIIKDILTISESSMIFLPRLERLYLIALYHGAERNRNPDDFTPVIAMTRSRWHLSQNCADTSRLAFLGFRTDERLKQPQHHGVLEPLLTLRDEGLEMKVDDFYLQKGSEL